MGDHQHRKCLNRLLCLTFDVDGQDHQTLAAEVDRMLACNGRRTCSAKLACSWLAAELADGLAQRCR